MPFKTGFSSLGSVRPSFIVKISVLIPSPDEVILGVAFGSVLGIGFRHLMKFCERKDLIDRQSYVA